MRLAGTRVKDDTTCSCGAQPTARMSQQQLLSTLQHISLQTRIAIVLGETATARALDVGNTSSADRWICQRLFLIERFRIMTILWTSPGKTEIIPQLVHDRFLPNPSQFINMPFDVI